MNEAKETENIQGLKKVAIRNLLPFFEICPQVIQPGIGIETFVEELNKASEKIIVFPINKMETIRKMLYDLIKVCPHIVQPGIGAEAFADELIRASAKYASYTNIETPEKI